MKFKPNKLARGLAANSRKQEFYFHVAGYSRVSTSSYWSGGGRDYYLVYNMNTRAEFSPPCGVFPNFEAYHELQPNEVLIRTGVFAGKKATPCFIVRPEDESRSLELFRQK